jgi:hypothetical protein
MAAYDSFFCVTDLFWFTSRSLLQLPLSAEHWSLLRMPVTSSASVVRWTLISLTNAESECESYVTTDGQLASLSWNKPPIWGLRPDMYYCHAVKGLLTWGALSDERVGPSFTTAAGPRQRSHSRVRVPWISWPYFTVSDSRLPCSSPPTTRWATVEVTNADWLNPAFVTWIETTITNSSYVTASIRCRGNVLTEPLLSKS